jgi:hypothetical protein
MDVFSKLPQKNNLDHESSSFFDPAAKDKTGF